MSEVNETPRRDLHDLYVYLSAWRSQNKISDRVEYRWIAMVLEQVEKLVGGLKNGGIKTLGEHDQERLRQFEIGELEAKRATLESEQHKLEGQIAKLKRPPLAEAA